MALNAQRFGSHLKGSGGHFLVLELVCRTVAREARLAGEGQFIVHFHHLGAFAVA